MKKEENVVIFVRSLLQVIGRARDEASDYRFSYSQPIPVKVLSVCDMIYVHVRTSPLFCHPPPPPQHLVDRVSGFMHVYTLYSAVRPFGCTALFASCGPEGPALYMADPSGVAWVCYDYECCVCVYGLRLCVCVCRGTMAVLLGRPNRQLRLRLKNSRFDI